MHASSIGPQFLYAMNRAYFAQDYFSPLTKFNTQIGL